MRQSEIHTKELEKNLSALKVRYANGVADKSDIAKLEIEILRAQNTSANLAKWRTKRGIFAKRQNLAQTIESNTKIIALQESLAKSAQVRLKNGVLTVNDFLSEINALTNANFAVRENEIFGLIGADGAGKTTLIRILATLLLADKGECTILGKDFVRDFSQIRTHLGYMPAVFSLYADLSVEENLNFFANIFNVPLQANYALIEPIYRALSPFSNRRAGALSGGMKQKLALCCALIHKPKILLLDEPSTGVDALSRAEFWEILRGLKS